ncbi:MAG: flagellar protein FlaG [Lachnospiraceae bacterium]|nr:flagellar protein FlaG [Lachnospiraceae bacterium]MBR5943983.1 flagellar protein FlaG [Lachnospiraceae bacterium]
MALEPLSSMTAVQVQNTPEYNKVAKPETASTEAFTAENTPQVDATTLAIAKAEAKADANNNENPDSYEEMSKANHEKIRKAVEQLNKSMPHSEAVYGFHDETNRVTIKIVDKDTKEVIKELPPEKTLDMIARVWEMAGLLVDEKR